jgi:hypothetical protein
MVLCWRLLILKEWYRERELLKYKQKILLKIKLRHFGEEKEKIFSTHPGARISSQFRHEALPHCRFRRENQSRAQYSL